MADPDPFGRSFRWAWAEARKRRGEFWLAGGVFAAVTLVVGAILAQGLPGVPTTGDRVAIGLESAGLGIAAVLMLSLALGLVVAPYHQRNALRHMVRELAAEDSVEATLAWLRGELLPIYDQGRSVSLIEVCQALEDRVGLHVWTDQMAIAGGLMRAFPRAEGETGASGVEVGVYPLVKADLLEEEIVTMIDQEPILDWSSFSYSGGGGSPARTPGTRSVDRSHDRFRWTERGKKVMRALQPAIAPNGGRLGGPRA